MLLRNSQEHSILALALLHPLPFLKSDTSAPSRWDRQDPGHMTAAPPTCRLDPARSSLKQVHSFRAFAKRDGAALTAMHNLLVLYALLHFIVGFLCDATNIRAPRTYI